MNTKRAQGVPTRSIAREHGVPEPSLRRHFKLRHARSAPRPAPKPAAPPTPRHPKAEDPDPEVAFAKVKRAAAFLGVPLGELAACLTNHLEVTVTTASEAEQAELFTAWDEADANEEYVQAIVRNGTFYAETAETLKR